MSGKRNSAFCSKSDKHAIYSMSPIAVVMMGVFTACAHAELYFSPALVSADLQAVADLSRFEKEGAQLPGNYQVEIFLNGKFVNNRNLPFLAIESLPQESVKASGKTDIRDNTGLMACLTRSDLEALGVNIDPFKELKVSPDEQCLSPGKFIPQAFTAFDFQHMRLDISIPQAALHSNARGYISPERWDEGITAALLNYSFSGSTSNGQYGPSRSHYLNLNGGLNAGAWRLRDYRTWNSYDSARNSHSQWQHIKTYAERTLIPLRSQLTLGDSSTPGDVFDSVGFRGVQIATDDNMYPDSMRGFAPIIRGNARTNAQVTIQQNGYTIYQSYVAPGAFAIRDLYSVSSSGDLDVRVLEADGGVEVFTVPYSSVPILQREGYLKYALTGGQFQAGGESYSTPEFMQGTLIWGLPHNITAYSGVQYSQNYFSGVLGSGLNLGVIGAFSADVTLADSTLSDGSRQRGRSLRFLYARSLNSLGTTFQLTGYRYSTEGFHTLDETARKGMDGWNSTADSVDAEGRPIKRSYSDYYNLYNNKRAKIQASISQRLGDIGALYFSGVRQTYWNISSVHESLQAGFNSTIGSVSYNFAYNYNRESNEQNSEKSLSFSFSVPLDAFLSPGRGIAHSIYATYNGSRDNQGNITHQAGLSGTALADNNLSWNASQGYSRKDQNSGNLNANYQGRYGNGNLGYSYSENYRQVSYGLAGGALIHQDGLTLGQPLGDTSVLIAAPGVSGVAIENERGIRTDWRGYAIKPYASVYRENRVGLDTASLDDDMEIEEAVNRVVPTRGAVVRAEFKGHAGHRILMTLNFKGKLLPFGAMVISGERSGIVGDDGQVYLSGMPESGRIQATWGNDEDKHCTANYTLSKKDLKSAVSRIVGICR